MHHAAPESSELNPGQVQAGVCIMKGCQVLRTGTEAGRERERGWRGGEQGRGDGGEEESNGKVGAREGLGCGRSGKKQIRQRMKGKRRGRNEWCEVNGETGEDGERKEGVEGRRSG